MAAVAVSAVASAILGWGHITSFLHNTPPPAQALSSPTQASASSSPGSGAPAAQSKVIGIRWRTADLVPAAQAGRICVTALGHGRICASYVVGERPADTLTRRIEGLGLHVESNG
jgi:hypothetical protein